MPPLDEGKAAKKHLAMLLKSAMATRGYVIHVYPPVVFENEYEEAPPETVPMGPPVIGKALIGQPVEGLNISGDIIRLSDVEKQVQVTTTLELLEGSQVVAFSPDGKELNLRITEAKSVHPLSEIHWVYYAVMT